VNCVYMLMMIMMLCMRILVNRESMSQLLTISLLVVVY
jgi:hypothetical protein